MSASARVVVQNLWGRRGDWPSRRGALLEGLRALDPDLVALPEAVVNEEYDQVADVLGGDFHVAHQQGREPAGDDVERGQGHSLASRWPLGAVRELDLHLTPRTEGFACGILAVEVLAPPPVGPLVFAFHNPSWKLDQAYERELQAVAAARFLAELAAECDARHVLLAADLDADPVSASARFWTGRQSLGGTSVCYRDAWESVHPGEPGHTFTPENPIMIGRDWPFRRIDYLFVRCGEHEGPTLEIVGCERLFTEPVDGVWASDHFGLCVDLRVPADG